MIIYYEHGLLILRYNGMIVGGKRERKTIFTLARLAERIVFPYTEIRLNGGQMEIYVSWP